MKVLHIFAGLKFSGGEIMYVAAAKTFQKMGCDLYAVATHQEKGEYAPFFEKAGFTVMHWPYENLSLFEKLRYWKNVYSYIRKNHIDVLHIHRHNMKCSMGFCAWLAGRRSVYTYHSVFYSPRITYPYHVMLRWISKYVFHQAQQSISDSVYENELVSFHNKTIKVYNWYNSSKFYPATENERREIRQELNIPENALVIVSVGGCSYIKRHEDIIEAMIKIKDIYHDSVYLHLGQGTKTEEEKVMAESVGVIRNVRFLGNQEDVRKYLIASDIYVMTSKQEGASLTTYEAMACGIPAVLYNVPGLRDFNNDTECVLLTDEKPDRLADAIILLFKDKEKQNELCNNAITLVKQKYDMVTNAEKIYHLYEN